MKHTCNTQYTFAVGFVVFKRNERNFYAMRIFLILILLTMKIRTFLYTRVSQRLVKNIISLKGTPTSSFLILCHHQYKHGNHAKSDIGETLALVKDPET
jgi:hypothetical protein